MSDATDQARALWAACQAAQHAETAMSTYADALDELRACGVYTNGIQHPARVRGESLDLKREAARLAHFRTQNTREK